MSTRFANALARIPRPAPVSAGLGTQLGAGDFRVEDKYLTVRLALNTEHISFDKDILRGSGRTSVNS